ncbi:MAG: radical SAM protein, partial [Thermodesulfobacteriota bacterium]
MTSWRLIQKAKAILEKERGTVLKPWGGRISVCLIYPNSYHVGMSNLGFQILYWLLNAEEDVVCERAFLPEKEDLEEHRRSETPLFSLESQKPLSDFDLLAFSISFENDYLNILSILELGRIPLLSQDRGEGNPLVIGGGVSVFLNPEPLSPFFDLFILGEAEEVIREFLEVFRKWWLKREVGKEDLLRDFSKIEGVYIPKFYRVIYKEDGRIEEMIPEPGLPPKVKRRWIKEINQFPARSVLFTPDTEFKEMVLIEMNRGCPRGCRFCAAYSAYYPFRNRSLSVLESLIQKALLEGRRIGLTGTAVSDHPQLVSLCQTILSKKGKISTSSLRVDAIHPPLIQCLKEAQERTLSIAPEAGSERLRKILGKDYTEEEILRAIDILV